MKALLASLLIVLSASTVFAQSLISDNGISGTWKGASICQVKNSPCHDEIVVYHISKVHGVDTFNISASKIVDGKDLYMGIVGCKLNRKSNKLVSNSAYGQWSFDIDRNTLTGTLYQDGILYRKVKLAKQR